LVDLKRPTDKDVPYIILESLNSEKNSSRTVHTVTITSDRTSFTLGRGHDSDLRINDISVSRKHASIEYKDGRYYFVDLKSKFGTLALLSHDVELVEQNSQTFQIGRTVVTLKAKSTQPWKNKDKLSGVNMQEAIYKDPNIKNKFMQDQQVLMSNQSKARDKDLSPASLENSRKTEEEMFANKKIIELNGKRYVVIQELDPNEDQDQEEQDPGDFDD